MEFQHGTIKHAVGSAGVPEVSSLIAAAHELKSPLALMRQLSLALEAGDCTPKEARLLAQRITLTSERALRLTADLTRASRLQETLFDLEPINPVSLLEDVAHELMPLYAAKGKELHVVGRKRSILAVANRDLLRRVVTNFADNALHYSAQGEPVLLSAKSLQRGEGVRLSVRDYGPALPPKVWKTIHDSLGVRTQALHMRPESSGLGMYVAGQFAGAMGAQLGVVRHRDGATFYIDLTASTQMRLL